MPLLTLVQRKTRRHCWSKNHLTCQLQPQGWHWRTKTPLKNLDTCSRADPWGHCLPNWDRGQENPPQGRWHQDLEDLPWPQGPSECRDQVGYLHLRLQQLDTQGRRIRISCWESINTLVSDCSKINPPLTQAALLLSRNDSTSSPQWRGLQQVPECGPSLTKIRWSRSPLPPPSSSLVSLIHYLSISVNWVPSLPSSGRDALSQAQQMKSSNPTQAIFFFREASTYFTQAIQIVTDPTVWYPSVENLTAFPQTKNSLIYLSNTAKRNADLLEKALNVVPSQYQPSISALKVEESLGGRPAFSGSRGRVSGVSQVLPLPPRFTLSL
jgi:hypothetical protein